MSPRQPTATPALVLRQLATDELPRAIPERNDLDGIRTATVDHTIGPDDDLADVIPLCWCTDPRFGAMDVLSAPPRMLRN
jgi:hypothetical protein